MTELKQHLEPEMQEFQVPEPKIRDDMWFEFYIFFNPKIRNGPDLLQIYNSCETESAGYP